MKRYSLIGLALLGSSAMQAQLVVNNTLTPTQLVQDVLLGTGVTISNVSYNGVLDPQTPIIGSGSFTETGTNLGLPAGVVLSSGMADAAAGPATNFASNPNGTGSDPDLFQLSNNNTINDRAVLEFDFIPVGDTVRFRFVFGSEEYPEFVCSGFNDAFGFFLSGPGISGAFTNGAENLALVPGGSIPIAINTVNAGVPGGAYPAATCAAADPNWIANSQYYVNNTGTTIVYDGFTTVLTAKRFVQCGQTYHIKMAIGDAGDSAYDSAVFLEAGSFTSTPFIPTLTPGPGILGNNTILESCYPVTINFTQTGAANDTSVVQIITGGTATGGVDYVPDFPDSLVFLPGDSVQTFTFNCPIDGDGDETIILTLISPSPCAGITITNEFIFNIIQSAPVTIVGGFETIPCGGSTTLTPTVAGGYPPYTVSWSNGETGNSITVSPNGSAVYTATATDDCGSTAIAQFFVEMDPLPPLNMAIIGPGTVMEACDNTGVNFIRPQGVPGDAVIEITYSGQANNGSDFQWNNTVTIPDGVLNTIVPFNPLEDNIADDGETVTITGTYTDSCGRTTSASVTITIVDAPPIGVTTEDFSVECQPDSMLITATGIGGVGSLSYTWSNGSQGFSTYVSMNTFANYTVTVTDDCGRSASDIATISLICDVVIPNVFSPNGDGHNDLFVIDGIEYTSNTVRIYNRWGQLVFESSNYRNQWNGGDLPDGTYFYEVVLQHKKDDPYTGHVTILRNGWR
ncbi:MAG: choice-of-anchor L domain-containing protein [Flavobacteriales bacterium]|nr:choice-of-anchor L domain-containing protein [Flavobacteriales bacterium]